MPTDKPSRLFYNVGGSLLFTNFENYNGVNIYITDDSEIKEDNWCIDINGKHIKKDFHALMIMIFLMDLCHLINGLKNLKNKNYEF